MNTQKIKEGVLNTLYEVLEDLTLQEIEDLKDALTAREHALTDDGQRMSLEEVRAMLS